MAGTYVPKANTGTLFKNEKKEADTHADYKGEAGVVCPHCGKDAGAFLDAWINTAKNGSKYLAVKLKFKERQP